MNNSGITYYKQSEIYEGDKTKKCSLTIEEMDGNLHFLRGKDIKEVLIVKNGLEMNIILNNGEKFIIPCIFPQNKPFDGAVIKFEDGKVIWG